MACGGGAARLQRLVAPAGSTTHSGGPGPPSVSPLGGSPRGSRRCRATAGAHVPPVCDPPAAAGSDDPDYAGDAPYLPAGTTSQYRPQAAEPDALALARLEPEPAHGDERPDRGPDRDRHQVVTLPAVTGAGGEAVLERVRDVVEREKVGDGDNPLRRVVEREPDSRHERERQERELRDRH